MQPLMIDGVRFAYCWLGEIVPELNNAKVKNIAKASPWFNNFYPSGGLFSRKSLDFSSEEEQTAIAKITGWAQDYLRWMRDIHGASAPEEINLFNVNYFKNPEGNLNMDHFANLVAQEVREETKRKEDTATNLINNESIFNSNGLTAPNIGTVGLAKALYRGCASQYR
ncbi:MAG: hypothetical protein HC796_06860 [Synechococcaceae cyanobacterium RL_1_2]|nr:hypothetical protein [Synechococcaceae cyanobacterium RL_1_2]